jgi:hypothetical protein
LSLSKLRSQLNKPLSTRLPIKLTSVAPVHPIES